jgi:peptidyl-prolyl isomerase G (cyclophilin G)
VFGRVVSGIEVVKMIEDLPVDRNSRPLDEAMVKACGELVKQTKGKSFKFNSHS